MNSKKQLQNKLQNKKLQNEKRLQWFSVLSLPVLSLSLLLSCVGCTRLNRPPTCEEEAMVRETLEQTSPRAENNQPKAIQEFKFTWGGSTRKPKPTYPTAEDAVSDNDIRLDNR